MKPAKRGTQESVRQSKAKISKDKHGKPFICSGCREHFGYEAIGSHNIGGTCPKCGGALRSKVNDHALTRGATAKPTLGGL